MAGKMNCCSELVLVVAEEVGVCLDSGPDPVPELLLPVPPQELLLKSIFKPCVSCALQGGLRGRRAQGHITGSTQFYTICTYEKFTKIGLVIGGGNAAIIKISLSRGGARGVEKLAPLQPKKYSTKL